MEPIPETGELLEHLGRGAGDQQLDLWLLKRAREVSRLIPDCAGISIALIGELGWTFTFVATSDPLRVLDGAQYLDGGPCEEAVRQDARLDADLFDEERWHLASLAAAAAGIRSSLSMPIRSRGRVLGSVNCYGRRRTTFTGRARGLATLFGATAEEATTNADLSMTGVDRARQASRQVQDNALIDVASGYLAGRHQVPVDQARQRIEHAAARAGIPAVSLARLIMDDRSGADA